MPTTLTPARAGVWSDRLADLSRNGTAAWAASLNGERIR